MKIEFIEWKLKKKYAAWRESCASDIASSRGTTFLSAGLSGVPDYRNFTVYGIRLYWYPEKFANTSAMPNPTAAYTFFHSLYKSNISTNNLFFRALCP